MGRRSAFVLDDGHSLPVQGTITAVHVSTVDVSTGTAVIRNVPPIKPLEIDDLEVSDIVALLWIGESPYVQAILGQDTALKHDTFLDTTPPPAVSNLRRVQTNYGDRAEWDYNFSNIRDLAFFEVDGKKPGGQWGYDVYPVNNGRNLVHYSLLPSEPIIIRVRAEDYRGNQSAWTVLSDPLLDTIAPPDPWGFAVEDGTGKVEMSWSGPSGTPPDLSHFEIYKADDSDGTGAHLVLSVGIGSLYCYYPMLPGTSAYFNIKAVDVSGNESDYGEDTWLLGTSQITNGENICTNADLERDYDGDSEPDGWGMSASSPGSIAWGAYGIEGGKGIRITIDTPDPGVGHCSVAWPSPITEWKVPAIEAKWTVSIYLKSTRYDEIIIYQPVGVVPPAVNDAITFNLMARMHNGFDSSGQVQTSASAYQVEALPNDWYRVSRTFDINTRTFDYIGFYLLVYNSTDSSVTIDIDRPMVELGIGGGNWKPGMIPAGGSSMMGLKVDVAGIESDELKIGKDGTIYSNLVFGAASTYDIGTALVPLNAVYADSFVGETGSLHDPVSLSTDANANLLSLTSQELGLDDQGQNLVFAGPVSGSGAPDFRLLVTADIPSISHDTGLSDVSPDDHHAQVHALSGGDHTGDLAFTQLDSLIAAPALTFDTTGDTGSASTLMRSDAQVALFDATVPSTIAVGDTAATGSTGKAARRDHEHGITTSSNPGAAASILASDASGDLTLVDLTLTADLSTSRVNSHLIPKTTDTYDLGSELLLWRHGWLSELDTILFAEQTISLFGGWFIVAHDSGTFPTDVGSSDTTIDFGETMTPGDFIVARTSLQVEYMSIGSLVSGTTYNVTRNLEVDVGGPEDWPAGTVYMVLGQSGDGRIELNAYDTPRINLLKQGAAYDSQTEMSRIGDLNGNWGFSAEEWGAAFGEYVSGKSHVLIDESGNVSIKNYNVERISLSAAGVMTIKDSAGSAVLTFDAASGAEITKKLTMPGSDSAIAIGATPPTSSSAGTGIWIDRTGLYALDSDTYQVKIDATDGSLYAGGGNVVLDVNGISIDGGTGLSNRIKFYAGSNEVTYLIGRNEAGGALGWNTAELLAKGTTDGYSGKVKITAQDKDGVYSSQVELFGEDGGANYAKVLIDSVAELTIEDGEVAVTGNALVGGGLYVGSTATDPDADTIICDGDTRVGGGLHVGETGYDAVAGCVSATSDGRFAGGVVVGSKSYNINAGTFGLYDGVSTMHFLEPVPGNPGIRFRPATNPSVDMSILEIREAGYGKLVEFRYNSPTWLRDGVIVSYDSSDTFSSYGSNMTRGVLINQEGADDHILSFHSSDVAHGMTSLASTDCFGWFGKSYATGGGLNIVGMKDADDANAIGLQLGGVIAETPQTTRGTTYKGQVNIFGAKISSTTWGEVGALENCISWSNLGSTRMIMTGNGNLYMDTTVTQNNWDEHDDIALMRSLRSDMREGFRERKSALLQKHREILEATGVVEYADDGSIWMSAQNTAFFTMDALLQLAERLTARLDKYERVLKKFVPELLAAP